jgi:uncharacterized RDD family membrane protein YckC
MNPRFQHDDAADPSLDPEATLIDPEAYDASEQEFAASLEQDCADSQPRLAAQADDKHGPDPQASAAPVEGETAEIAGQAEPSTESEPVVADVPASAPLPTDSESVAPDFWRQELAARLTQYRARRRPRGPRYPSLQLKFEHSEPVHSAPTTPVTTDDGLAGMASAAPSASHASAPVEAQTFWTVRAAESAARIIEFPRSSLLPPGPLEELAEPILARPRILDVPDTVSPAPALGGILLEPEEEPAPEKRPGIEIPLQPAPLLQRLLAAGTDATLVLLAGTVLGEIFYRIAGAMPPALPLLAAATAVAVSFWAMYQYLLLVHSGTTPGLQFARLQLSRFDGSLAPRRLRRWRVLASVLSVASLGLGYAWCLLDEDGLCWHDRITRTYLAPGPRTRRASDEP